MPTPLPLAKARLVELDVALKNEQPGGKQVTVQFNPETLKVSFTNQVVLQLAGGTRAPRARSRRRQREARSCRCSCGST